MVIKRRGLKHISKLVKKVTKKAKAPKVDKLKTKTSNFFIIIIFLIKQYQNQNL